MSKALLIEGQWRILKGVASGAPLKESLNELVLLIEFHAPGMLGSVLLLDGDQLCLGAAPNLPAAYSHAIDRIRIGPAVGSCGTAAYLKRRVLVEDIDNDPLWEPYRSLAKAHGLRACWSMPIFSRDGNVIGTFAMYYRKAMRPLEEHLALIDTAAQTASIAIQTYCNQRELDESTKRLGLAVQASGMGLWDWDPVLGKIVYSREWKKQIGYEDHEINSEFSEWKNRLHPDDSPSVMAHLEKVLAGPQDIFEIEFRLRHKDGSWRSIYSKGTVYRNSLGKVVRMLGCHMDVTEQKKSIFEQQRLQTQLNRVQKMESIGTLAGGIAHDFNNMLNIILGYSDLALQHLAPENRARSQIIKIREAADRSANLTQQLLAFARRQPISPVDLDLNQTVSGLIDMLRRLIGESIELEWRPGSELWSVKFDPAQVDQILANLCTNARDAIKGSGRILIETRNSASTKDPTSDGILKDFVVLRIEDNGSGIQNDHIERIFEPFYTTKELGQGTGLGLAMVYGIIRQNAGFISVKSAIGQGSSFEIYLPRSGAVASAPLKQTHVGGKQKGSGIVLVAEDEKGLCELIETVLTESGYQVLSATTPSQAIEMAKQCKRIDILLTDIVMPQMNGQELANEVCKLHPSIKMIFMSGYTTDASVLNRLAEQQIPFIQKPFSIRNLTRVIQERLH